MRIPPVTDRRKTSPAQALRNLFAGIGQLLMAADRAGNPGTDGPDGQRTRWRSLDQTGNVRILTPEEVAAKDAADDEAEGNGATPQGAARLPVPNYDGLSIASLRARLRHLDVAELRVLLGYEQANADRDDVVTMFRRRIAKLDGEA